MAISMKNFDKIKKLKDIKLKDINLKDIGIGDINVEKAKERIDKVVAQAKDSLKVLETLQKEGIALAKNLVELPVGKNAKNIINNEKVMKNLGKIGLATQAQVKELEKKIESLATELHTQISKMKNKNKSSNKPEDDVKTV